MGDDLNPLDRPVIYNELGLSPFASSSEIADKLKTLNEDQINRLKSKFPEQFEMLDSPAKRVLINALLLDPVNSRHIIELLSSLPGNLRDEEMKMPDLDIKDVIKEGESLAFAQKDFQDVEFDAELEIDMDVIEALLKTRAEPKIIKFDS